MDSWASCAAMPSHASCVAEAACTASALHEPLLAEWLTVLLAPRWGGSCAPLGQGGRGLYNCVRSLFHVCSHDEGVRGLKEDVCVLGGLGQERNRGWLAQEVSFAFVGRMRCFCSAGTWAFVDWSCACDVSWQAGCGSWVLQASSQASATSIPEGCACGP